MAEKRMTVDLVWDDEHGRDWMNIYNLELLLYSKLATRRDLLRAELPEPLTKAKQPESEPEADDTAEKPLDRET